MNLATQSRFSLYSQGRQVDGQEFCDIYARSHVARGSLNGIGAFPTTERGMRSLRKFLQDRLTLAAVIGRNPLPFVRVDNPIAGLGGMKRELGLRDDEYTDAEVFAFKPFTGAGSAAVYASVGAAGLLQLANGDSTNISGTILAGVAAGRRLKEVRTYSGPTTAPGTGICCHQLTDGTTVNVIEVQTLVNTANIQQNLFFYTNQILPSTSYLFKSQMRTAITSGGTLHISTFGEDLT